MESQSWGTRVATVLQVWHSCLACQRVLSHLLAATSSANAVCQMKLMTLDDAVHAQPGFLQAHSGDMIMVYHIPNSRCQAATLVHATRGLLQRRWAVVRCSAQLDDGIQNWRHGYDANAPGPAPWLPPVRAEDLEIVHCSHCQAGFLPAQAGCLQHLRHAEGSLPSMLCQAVAQRLPESCSRAGSCSIAAAATAVDTHP